MRLVYFASGGAMGLVPLLHLASQHDIVAVVRPGTRGPLPWRWLASLRRLVRRRPDAIDHLTHRSKMCSLRMHGPHDPWLASQLRALQPEVICIATFPWLLPSEVFTIPSYGTINLHGSLLPRHRGPNPLFWVYYHDDRQTGVTVHRVNARADAGAILCQEAIPLPRGCNINQLHGEKAQRGAQLLRQAVAALEAGTAARLPQDEALATPAPRVRRGAQMVPFSAWEVERVWHFLAGLYPHFIEPLVDHAGRQMIYSQVRGYVAEAHQRRPGSVERTAGGWHLYCRGGFVQLGQPPHGHSQREAICSTSSVPSVSSGLC